MEKVVIIGCGAAGLTAAIYAARANLAPVVVTGSLPGGLLTQTTDVENYPGFPEAVNGFDLMFKFQQQAERFGTKMVNDTVVKVELVDGGPHKLELGSGEVIETAALIIATGASPRWLGLPSEDRLKNHGVSACATCDGAFYRDVPVVVIGGGDTAMEEASFLTKFASKVTVIHRRDELRASKIMADRALNNDKIEFCWDSVVEEVLGETAVEGIRVKNLKTGESAVIDCVGYFAALGHVPSTQIFAGVIDMDDKGFIILKNNSSYTNIAGVFGAGDCADSVYRQAVTAAGMGCKAAIDAERWLTDQE
jgi:thioredoxin reductase (NADPH)